MYCIFDSQLYGCVLLRRLNIPIHCRRLVVGFNLSFNLHVDACWLALVVGFNLGFNLHIAGACDIVIQNDPAAAAAVIFGTAG